MTRHKKPFGEVEEPNEYRHIEDAICPRCGKTAISSHDDFFNTWWCWDCTVTFARGDVFLEKESE